MKLNMSKPIVAVLIPALIGIISCSDNPIKSGGENAESGRSESAGEHSGNAEGAGHEGREGSEGGAGRLVASSGGGEGGEGGGEHGSGAGGGEGGESHAGSEGGDAGGEGQPLAPDQRYDQTRNGARLVMVYDSTRNAFYGLVKNTTNQTLTRVRVEIHLSDAANAIIAELGPTTPTDLAPGGMLPITLSAAGQTFTAWSPHVEVGSGEGGEGSGEHGSGTGGSEGGEGGGGEGNETSGHAEGPEGGGGDPSSPILALDESFDGVVNGVRVAMSYDPVRRSFSGTVENAMALTACSVQIELNLKQGTRTVVELGPSPVGDLAPGASATTELLVDDEPLAAGVAFDAWEIHPEVFDCNCPVPNSSSGEGGEGGESHAGREGSEGSEGGDIAQQLAPDQSYDQTRNGARLTMSYSPSQDAFYGTVENTTNQTLTRVRVEIHLTDQSGAIIAELGPTTPTDLAPGGMLLITLPAAGQAFTGWSPHAEVGSGEGGEGGGSESGGEHGSGAGGGEGGGEHGSGAGGGEGGESHAGREGGSG